MFKSLQSNHFEDFTFLSPIFFIDDEKRKLKIHVEQLEREKNMSQGRLGEIAVKVSDLEQELLEERLATAAEKYRKKLVEKCARDQVIKDLDTYYKALDWAIMRFHKEKMKRINLIIKELWRQTYRGNDIDYIEIRTDDGEVAGGADKKKSYNYRYFQVLENSKQLNFNFSLKFQGDYEQG